MYIDGSWVDSEEGKTFDVVSPASGEVLGRFPKGSAEDAKAAVEVAVEAQETIARMPIQERCRLGVRVAEEIGKSVKEFAVDCSLEHGKPLRESIAEVEDAIPNLLQIVFISREQIIDHFHFAIRLLQKRPHQR